MNIRNFVIIAHIDHGKSTLADRFLEITNAVPKDKLVPQFLDRMNLERERGVTIKMHPVRMIYSIPGSSEKYILNLIDTPGHVDFNYEVSRALAAVEGAILLVDGTQGIQAQTLSNLNLAQKQGIKIIGAINKIDLMDESLRQRRQKELADLLHTTPENISLVSAKTGEGVEQLLRRVITEVPSPVITSSQNVLKALVFDSYYDDYRGVIAHIRIFQGQVKIGDTIKFLISGAETKVSAVGYFNPDLRKTSQLQAGEIGWVATGLKNPNLVRIGDTITLTDSRVAVQPLLGYQEPQPMIYASFYLAQENKDFDLFRQALLKLKLNDWALQFTPENSDVLGRGFRRGFLGLFHLEIVKERLKREYGLEFIITDPTVPYRLRLKGRNNYIVVTNPTQWPSPDKIVFSEEPWAEVKVMTPPEHLSRILRLIHSLRGDNIQTYTFGENLVVECEMPLRETIRNFYDQLKSVSQGFASLVYKVKGYRKVDLVKLEVWLAGKKFESLSSVVVQQRVEKSARELALKLKELLPRQNYPLPIQVKSSGRIIARETIPALRKDVTGYLYGGDRTRKMKLWKKQKQGKKRLLRYASLQIPPSVFLKLFSKEK